MGQKKDFYKLRRKKSSTFLAALDKKTEAG